MDWMAFAIPPLMWVRAYTSSFLKTYRTGLSASLSLVAGALLFASLRVRLSAFPWVLGAAGLALGAMLVAMLWAPSRREKRKDR